MNLQHSKMCKKRKGLNSFQSDDKFKDMLFDDVYLIMNSNIFLRVVTLAPQSGSTHVSDIHVLDGKY